MANSTGAVHGMADSPASTTSGSGGLLKRYPLASYFVLAFVGTWLAVAPLVLGQDGSGLFAYRLPDWLYLVIYVFSAYTGPILAAYLVLRAEGGKASVRPWLRRFVLWRVGIHWYAVAIFGVYLVWLLAHSLIYRGLLSQTLLNPAIWSIFASMFLVGMVVPGYGEEAGWRGFALPRLQQRVGPLAGSLVLGLLHALWHLPVFFTPFLGPFTPLSYGVFILTTLGMTTIYTWITNNTRGSILIAVLVHASINASSSALGAALVGAVPQSAGMQAFVDAGWVNALTFGVVALLLVAITRGQLSYRDTD